MGWWPEEALRNQIIHYCTQSLLYVILTIPSEQPFSGATRSKNKVRAAEKPTSL